MRHRYVLYLFNKLMNILKKQIDNLHQDTLFDINYLHKTRDEYTQEYIQQQLDKFDETAFTLSQINCRLGAMYNRWQQTLSWISDASDDLAETIIEGVKYGDRAES